MSFRLTTSRLFLDGYTEEEIVRIITESSDDALMQFYGFENTDAVAVERQKAAGGYSTWRTQVLIFIIKERATELPIGSFAFHNWYAQHRRSEIGYHIIKDEHKRKGYMSEVLDTTIAYGFSELNLNRIEAVTSTTNEPSIKLLQNNGFKQEALLEQHWMTDGVAEDSLMWALLHKDFLQFSNK